MFHSANFKLTNTDMKDHLTKMTTMLEDPTQLKNDSNAKAAVQHLKQVTQNHLKWGKLQIIITEVVGCKYVYCGYIFASDLYDLSCER